MKAHIFVIANLKFRLQTPCSFGDMAENVILIGIPINNFLCIYIIASSPGLHTLFCLWRVNEKLPQGETSQNTFQRSRSISWKSKIHMVKWAHPPLNNSSLTRKKILIFVQKLTFSHWTWPFFLSPCILAPDMASPNSVLSKVMPYFAFHHNIKLQVRVLNLTKMHNYFNVPPCIICTPCIIWFSQGSNEIFWL